MVLVAADQTGNRGTKTKAFLDRWRSKATGTVYCDACTQTGRNGQVTRERNAQTDFYADKCTDTARHVAVQVDPFPDARDRLVEARNPSRDSSFKEPSNEKIAESVVKIQRFYRAHRGRRATIQATTVSPRAKDTEEQEISAEPRSYRSQDFVILNRTSPRTRTDFELLYNLLDRWRASETKRASLQPFEPSRIALRGLILSKEVELLRAIDSLKTDVQLRRTEKSRGKFLDELSRPAVWRDRRGESILVDTPRAQRARSFRDAYRALCKQDTSPKERVETLSRLREDVERHTCKPSNDLIRLLDQEINLLARDVDPGKLNWLRERLKISFLTLARDALANDPEDTSLIGCFQPSRKTICRSCGRLLPVEKFPREGRRRSTSCNYCLYVKVRTAPRIVYGPYERLLRDVRRGEARMQCHTSPAFAIDAEVVYRLVNDVWHGKSAISENDNLDQLKLVRFRTDVEWSPWNCLLLTAREAAVHGKLRDLEKFYGAMMLQKFHTKNLQARAQFGSVTEIARAPGK